MSVERECDIERELDRERDIERERESGCDIELYREHERNTV